MKSIQPTVLVAPLNWGLGHATRCIPVIRELLAQNARVIVAASGNGREILNQLFPSCIFTELPGTEIHYSQNLPMAVSILGQVPSILASIRKEHERLKGVTSEFKLTHVISDNRYGLYHPTLKTAFLSHQVHIRANGTLQFLEPLLFRINKSKIEKFDELWIPDIPPPGNLSGLLSDTKGIHIPVRHVGLLSRFSKKIKSSQKKYDVVALLSGPEPQRTLLEQKIIKFMSDSGKNCLLVQGTKNKQPHLKIKNIRLADLISDDELMNALHEDTLVICRSGYSTIMDMAYLDHRKILFIPTPGQTEQEYLAQEMHKRFDYTFIQQDQSIPVNDVSPGKKMFAEFSDGILKKTIGDFLSD